MLQNKPYATQMCYVLLAHANFNKKELVLYNINLLYASLVCMIIQMIRYRPDRLCYCIEG